MPAILPSQPVTLVPGMLIPSLLVSASVYTRINLLVSQIEVVQRQMWVPIELIRWLRNVRTVVQQAIEQVLSTMPESTRVGIITFGSMVYLHNLMATSIATSSVFRGSQEATKNDVAGLIRRGGATQSPFLAPLGTCSFTMDGVLEGLTPEANAQV